MIKLFASLLILGAFMYSAGTAAAQHADIRPYVENGQIHTAGFVDATSTEIPNLRAFGYDFGEDPGQPYFAQDPGFNAAAGSGLTAGSQLLFNIVGAESLGLAANLGFWDGTGAVEFAATPAAETLTLNFGSQNRIVDDSTSFVTGFGLQTVTASGAVHRHLNAFLNGSSGDPTAGIYLLSLELASSDSTIAKSAPFFVVYNNGLDEEIHDAAIDWVERHLAVPEPSVLWLLVGGAIWAGLVANRSRWRRLQRLNGFTPLRPPGIESAGRCGG